MGPKPRVAERRRERDVWLLYGSTFRSLPFIESPATHSPRRACTDSTLVALAQLAATRLRVVRACISLIDDKHQHFIAEATPTLSLHPDPEEVDSLWLGSVSVPRSWGICERVLDLQTDQPALIINDLSQHERYAHRDFVNAGPQWRFYAGAPLVSPSGTRVGAVSIWDDQPRDGMGLPDDQLKLLTDFAATITNYLDTYTIREQFQRGEKFTRGLLSFAQGASALRPFKSTDESTNPSDAATAVSGGQSLNTSSVGSRTIQAVTSTNDRSIGTLQNSILPPNSRDMFSRAAQLMMASSNLDGVLILDASVAATGHRQFPGGNDDDDDDPTKDDSQSKSSSSDESSLHSNTQDMHSMRAPKKCSVLGYATQRAASPSPDQTETFTFGSLAERDLARLLKEAPMGKVLNYTAQGLSVSSTEDFSSTGGSEAEVPSRTGANKPGTRHFKSTTAIHEMLPKARSVAFVPFWDYERSRWFAGCLCWSESDMRLLSPNVDLAYFKIFSDSIMRELSRLDALASHQTTFVASISHELRSPLHGILGTLEFMKETPLDAFQRSMLSSLHSCGQTLLDTINQVMDYSKSSESSKTVSSKKLKGPNTLRLSSKPIKNRKVNQSAFDISIATEEVVEAVFSGSLYVPIFNMSEDTGATSPPEPNSRLTTQSSTDRKTCYVVLDIAQHDDWVRCFPVGAWKRIVMNLFGNAVKYTMTGHIHVSLRLNEIQIDGDDVSAVTLIIKDTGAGMSPSFLANQAFRPFSQENPHSDGVGLGLSIVRQLIETSGGKMEVSSEPSVGTKFTVKLALKKPDIPKPPVTRHTEFLAAVSQISGHRICVLRNEHELPPDSSDSFGNNAGLSRFTNALVSTLENQLEMKVVQTGSWTGHGADIVICPEPSFEYLNVIRRRRNKSERAPVTVFVAMDALEASTFRSDVRVQSKESVVEIITQPCGPFKLAHVLNKCIDRFNDSSQNLPVDISPESSVPSSRWEGFKSTEALTSENILDPNDPSLLTPTPSNMANPLDAKPGSTSIEEVATVVPVPESTAPRLEIDLPLHPKAATQVLVTDDNAINRKLLGAFLKKHKLQYAEAENGLKALQCYQNGAVRYDFILMDMSMPVMDGMTATRAIRQYEQTYNVRPCCIVALTGLTSNSARLEAWKSGIDQYMTKPINFKRLAEILLPEKDRDSSDAKA